MSKVMCQPASRTVEFDVLTIWPATEIQRCSLSNQIGTTSAGLVHRPTKTGFGAEIAGGVGKPDLMTGKTLCRCCFWLPLSAVRSSTKSETPIPQLKSCAAALLPPTGIDTGPGPSSLALPTTVSDQSTKPPDSFCITKPPVMFTGAAALLVIVIESF